MVLVLIQGMIVQAEKQQNKVIYSSKLIQFNLKYLMFWQRLKEEWQTQCQRYSRTKYGKIAAFLIYYLLYTGIPFLLKMIMPFMSLHFTQKQTYALLFLTAVISTSILWNISMMLVYKIKHPFFQQYRVNPDPWPWQSDPIAWRSLLYRSIRYTATDLLLISPILLYIDTSIDFKIVMDLNSTPTLDVFLPQFIIMLFLEDLIFFISHWALHHPSLYHFHKIHHEYTVTVSIAGLHSHFIQFLLSNSISVVIYVKIAMLYAPMHISTILIWGILRMWDANQGHCGYVFSWAPLQLVPFCANDDFHDFHHSHNCGNFASQLRVWDSLFGTNKAFRDYKAKKMLAHRKIRHQ